MSKLLTSTTTSRPIGMGRNVCPRTAESFHNSRRRSLQPTTAMRHPWAWQVTAKSATSSGKWASSPIGSPLTTAIPSRVR